MQQDHLTVRHWGQASYEHVWHTMRLFTDRRDEHTEDEFWLVEHLPVFTQGQAGKPEHILNPGDIPLVQTDRGGQVTYHGPGQLVLYLLLDVRRKKLGVRNLVTAMESSIVKLLALYQIDAYAKPDAPGVYVGESKIASLGLRVRRGCSFHGLALNVNMDLTPFLRINPCGYAGMAMTQCCALGGPQSLEEAQSRLVPLLAEQLGYQHLYYTTEKLKL
ncbi:octanoyltransferase [Zobellella denitrificans]|jgi:lipoyl(octanoyl) transferase|uniref:Octanoyltransferase n=1 Tax=Zobellella denitrificans TaxID=347534 RepID=A0A231MYC7_9GAMM|nr:lipoyl(octanoyl) transferase LipB [Zobellella denitrificans]ATG74772.1 octanoyltransferase [Zobellella denitrificans]OXS15231.1 octanoyltransferase [Zobellella denitrificans]